MLVWWFAACSWWSAPTPSCEAPLVAAGQACCFPGQTAASGACAGPASSCPEGWSAAPHGCTSSVSVDSVVVPAGTFDMGCDALARDDCGNDTTPVHTVTLTRPLRVMTHEMTQAVHRALTGASPSRLGGCDRCPVEQVSWYDAVRAANALSLSEGLVPAYAISGETVAWDRAADGWRLPTEAEWEYAARGGDDHVYAGSDDRDAVAWWQGNSEGRPSEVGTKAANGYGLHDLSGNVWEWTWNHPEPYTDAPKTDPAGPDAAVLTSPDPSSRGDERVLRGGAWADFPEGCQVTYRGWITARHTDVVLGYRLVRWE